MDIIIEQLSTITLLYKGCTTLIERSDSPWSSNITLDNLVNYSMTQRLKAAMVSSTYGHARKKLTHIINN